MALAVRILNEGDWEKIFLSGKIDEDGEVTLGELKDKVTGKCIFNFKEVTGINSCGVRAWINFMREVEKKGSSVIFEECTPDVISQINMIPNFKSKATIRCIPLDNVLEDGVCILTGQPSTQRVLFAKAY